MPGKTQSPFVAQATTDTSGGAQRKSSAAWMIVAWASFLVWLAHSFAVRSFLDSLHVLGKVLGMR